MSQIPATFLDLPPEILTSILLLVRPQDVSAVSRTCTRLHSLVEHNSSLWRNLFLDRWDPPSFARAGLDQGYARLLKERSGAMDRVLAGSKDEVAKLLHYNSVIRTLRDAVRDALPRQRREGAFNLEGPHSASVDTLKRLFSYDEAGEQLFSDFIYPREMATAYAAWKETGAGMSKAAGKLRVVDSQRHDDEEPEADGVTGERHAISSPNKRRAIARRVSSPRRSRRLLKASLPDELGRLFDQDPSKAGRDVWDLDSMDSPIDEEMAAELHCLHGARYWHRELDRRNLAERDELLDKEKAGETLDEEERERLEALLLELPLDPAEYDHRNRVAPLRGGRRSEAILVLGSREGRKGDMRLRGRARDRIYNCQRFGFENAWAALKPFRAREQSPEEIAADAAVSEDSSDASGVDGSEQGEISTAGSDAEMESDSEGDDAGPVPIEVLDDDDDDADDSSFEGGDSDVEIQEGSDDDLITDDIHLMPVDSDDDDDDNDDDDDDSDGMHVEMDPGLEQIDDGTVTDGEAFFRSLLDVVSKVTGRRVADATKKQIADGEAGLGPTWEEGIDPVTGLKRWRKPKRADWLAVESIMILTHTNIMAAAAKEWGIGLAIARSIPLALGWPSDCPKIEDETRALRRALWALLPPSGWDTSRGQRESSSQDKAVEEGSEADPASNPPSLATENPTPTAAKPFDWANVEGFWAGTYFFLDYSDFLMNNAVRGCIDHQDVGWPAGMRRPTSTSSFSLERQTEATGDFLCFELELRPLHEQKPEFEEGEEEAWYEGLEDPEFPTLRFGGRTVQYDASGQRVQSTVHGLARPVRGDASGGDDALGPVSAIHFTMTHTYDGEDRWRYEAVQPGPPGTRCPIYGIWTDRARGGVTEWPEHVLADR